MRTRAAVLTRSPVDGYRSRAACAIHLHRGARETAAERDALVAEACADDEALASRVRKLLAASDRDGDFLESPALAGRAQVHGPLPDAVGDYLVVRLLGSGGMATVYEAVQENPNRRVALKVMRGGIMRRDTLLRFRLEAETLAQLHHPGIAQIYEAGSAQLDEGERSPFFAMDW